MNESKWAANNELTKTINIHQKKANITKINRAIDFIKPLVVNKKISLFDAAKRWESQNLPQVKKVSDVIWNEVLIAFEKTKEGLSSKTGMEWTRRVDRFREVMNKKPIPNSGEDFVKKYAKNFFDDIPSGSDSRKRYLDSVYKILEYGVNRHGMSERWLPPHKDLAKELVGDNTRTTEDTVTPPISDADLAILLDTLKETNPKLYLAVGLIALHGLRLSELATLEVRDSNKLFVGSIKKNFQNKGKKSISLSICTRYIGQRGTRK